MLYRNLYNSGCFFIDILSNIFEFKLERILSYFHIFNRLKILINLDLLGMVMLMFQFIYCLDNWWIIILV